MIAPLTVVMGCQARSRSATSPAGTTSAPATTSATRTRCRASSGWERGLGTHDLAGLRVAVVPDLGRAVVRPEVEASVRDAAEALVADAGLVLVDVEISLPGLGFEWAMANLAQLANDLGDLWPDCKDDLTREMAFGFEMAHASYDLTMAAKVGAAGARSQRGHGRRVRPGRLRHRRHQPRRGLPGGDHANTRVGEQKVGPENNGALTIPANIVGNPAVSIPVGAARRPAGGHAGHRPATTQDALLLDLALAGRADAALAPRRPRRTGLTAVPRTGRRPSSCHTPWARWAHGNDRLASSPPDPTAARFHLDARSREAGRKGVAKARAVLADTIARTQSERRAEAGDQHSHAA